MRVLNPHPFGHAPSHADLSGAIGRATSAALLDARGEQRIELGPTAIATLGGLLEVREGEPAFDQQLAARYGLELSGAQGPLGRLELAADGSVYWPAWNGWAELGRPRELFAWLAEQGLGEPLACWEACHGPAAEEALAAWRQAIPEALASGWDPQHERVLNGDFAAPQKQAELVGALGSPAAAIAALLEWYGAGQGPVAERPPYESLPRLVLAGFGFDPLVAVIPALDGDQALAGAARFLLDAAPLSPNLAAPVLALDSAARERVVAVAARQLGEADAARLRAQLFPTPVGCPTGASHVGTSKTRQLRALVCDAQGVFGVDGFELVRLARGETTVLQPLLKVVPLAAHQGSVLIAIGAKVRELSATGAVVAEHGAATAAQREQALAELDRLQTPPRDGIVAVAPSGEQRAAYGAFAHLGVPQPAAAALRQHHYLDPTAREILRPAAQPERVALPGQPLRACADASDVVVAIEHPSGIVVAWLDQAGALRSAPPVERQADQLCGLLAEAGHAFLVFDTGQSHLIAQVRRPGE